MAFTPLGSLPNPLYVTEKGGIYQEINDAVSFTIVDWDNFNNGLNYNDLSADVIGRAWTGGAGQTGLAGEADNIPPGFQGSGVTGVSQVSSAVGSTISPAVGAVAKFPEAFDYRLTGEDPTKEVATKSFFVFWDDADGTGNVVGVADFNRVVAWGDKPPVRF